MLQEPIEVAGEVALEAAVGFAGRADPAEGSDREPASDRTAYEPPRLRALGTLAELTRGVSGVSDGLGPGSALEDGGAAPRAGGS